MRYRQITHVFKNVQKRVQNTAQRRLTKILPGVMSALHDYVVDEQMKGKFGDMTGNWINSFGVALYRDGKCVAFANMGTEVNEPIRVTLIEGDLFRAGEERHDGSSQIDDFEPSSSTATKEQVFYDQKVLSYLARTRTSKKGFSFRVVTIAEYNKEEAKRALLRFSDELEMKGAYIWQFNIG